MEPSIPATLSPSLAPEAAEALLEHSNSLVALVEADGSLLDGNPAFRGIKDAQPGAVGLGDLVAPVSRPAYRELFRAVAESGHAVRATLEVLAGAISAEYDCQLIPLSAGNFLFLAEAPHPAPRGEEVARLTRDLQEVRKALHIKQTGLDAVLAQVDEIAHTDQLTFLSNQRKIVGDLQRKVSRSARSRKPFTIFLLDIDRFKRINDTYGHIVGDQVLRALAGELRDGIRQSDHIGRYGGEEFLILLPGTALESAIPLAERLLTIVRSLRIDARGQIVTLTVSIGIAQYHKDDTWKDFLERADKALYQAKDNGRDDLTVSKCPGD